MGGGGGGGGGGGDTVVHCSPAIKHKTEPCFVCWAHEE